MRNLTGLILYFIIFALSRADDNAVYNFNPAVETAFRTLSDAGHKGQEDVVRNALSDEYLSSVRKFDTFFKKKASGVKDFDFYTIVLINRVVVRDQVAFVEASVVFNPSFLATHQEAITGNTGAAIWTGAGGYGLSNKFEEDGTGRVTYYMVKQHGLWKLHYAYFSSKSLTDSDINIASAQMKTLVHPN